ncbi:hypothetical protein BDW22DRAFT_1362224 [Trametopsis cervina]|nr:hypothetical protein BDW22DRAFT_1362224 [Trametopsis cervina]
MSSVDSQSQRLIFLGNYTYASACVLWVADYFETLPMEVQAFWSRPSKQDKSFRTSPSKLVKIVKMPGFFFLNRYGFLLYVGMELWFTTPGVTSHTACHTVGLLSNALAELTTVSTCMLLILRAYAVSNQNWLVLVTGVLLLLGRLISGVYTNFVLITYVYTEGLPGPKCSTALVWEFKSCLLIYLQTATTCCTLVLDIFVFIVGTCTVLRQTLNMRRLRLASVARLIMRDNVLYFVVVAVVTICCTIANLVTSLSMYKLLGVMNPMYCFLPNMLVNRLVLNLRTYSDQPHSLPTSGAMRSAFPVFVDVGPSGENSPPSHHADLSDEENLDLDVPSQPTDDIEVVPR